MNNDERQAIIKGLANEERLLNSYADRLENGNQLLLADRLRTAANIVMHVRKVSVSQLYVEV